MSQSPPAAHRGSLLGASLLIAGSCIGAGMLGLPVLTSTAGFLPSVLLFVVAWAFMVATGLLLLEVNLWFKSDVSLVSMAEKTLGKGGKAVTWITFAFLFYCLMVAYITATGHLVVDFIQSTTGEKLPIWMGCALFIALFALLIYIGTGAVDHFNRWLMLGLCLSYALLICVGAPHVNMHHLEQRDWSVAWFIIPPMIISFGYHNLIPSLTTYLGHDTHQLKWSIIIGSFIPLVIYIIWEWLILGIVPLEGEGGFKQALNQGDMATQALRTIARASWVATTGEFLAFFAIITSFLGVALSFVDFIADALGIKKNAQGKLLLLAIVMLPPFAVAIIYPGVFLTALNYSGAFGAVILFGILPAAMAWKGRPLQTPPTQPLLPGGRPMLLLIIAFAVGVALLQLIHELSP